MNYCLKICTNKTNFETKNVNLVFFSDLVNFFVNLVIFSEKPVAALVGIFRLLYGVRNPSGKNRYFTGIRRDFCVYNFYRFVSTFVTLHGRVWSRIYY